MIAYKTLFTTGTLCLLCVSPLQAEEESRWESSGSPWSIEVGIGVENEPVYTGSDVNESEANAEVEVAYTTQAEHEFFVSLGEIGARWSLGNHRQLSTILEYEFGRDNSEDPALNNFPTIQDTIEVQAVYQQQIGPITAGIGVQYDIQKKGKGTVGFLGLAYQKALSERLGLQLLLDASFADATHLQTEVGITPETAAATGYSAYSPKGGYKGTSLSLGLQFAITPALFLKSELAMEHYGSLMSKSPLIAVEGTETTYESAVGLVYLF